MLADAKNQTMEDMLAQIRKIISDDDVDVSPTKEDENPVASKPGEMSSEDVDALFGNDADFDALDVADENSEQEEFSNDFDFDSLDVAGDEEGDSQSVTGASSDDQENDIKPSSDDFDADDEDVLELTNPVHVSSGSEADSDVKAGEDFDLEAELTSGDDEPLMVQQPDEISFDDIEPEDDGVSLNEPAPMQPDIHSAPAHQETLSSGTDGDHEKLMSNVTEQALQGAFSDLSRIVVSQQSKTLDDLIKDLMRPMIKNWLDAQLPGMVEKIIRQEIERITRK